MVEKSTVDRARAAYRADAEPKESGPSLAATKPGIKPIQTQENTKMDGEEGNEFEGKLDKILSHLGSLHDAISATAARCDALEKGGKKDSNLISKRADKEAAEGEEEREDGEGDPNREPGDPRELAADAQRHDSQPGGYRAKRNPGENSLYAEFQSKADAHFQAWSVADSAPRALDGESLTGYKARVASKLKMHSPDYKGVNLYDLTPNSKILNIAIDKIFADSMAACMNPAVGNGMGGLRPVTETDQSGRRITRYYGDAEACWGPFKATVRRLTKIDKNPNGRN